jgi:hypothetical protein
MKYQLKRSSVPSPFERCDGEHELEQCPKYLLGLRGGEQLVELYAEVGCSNAPAIQDGYPSQTTSLVLTLPHHGIRRGHGRWDT